MDNNQKRDLILYIEHYGIHLGAVKTASDEEVAINRNKLIAVIGYLVSQEHMFHVEITNKLVRMTIKNSMLEVVWCMEPSMIQKYIVEYAWQSPVGLHGQVVHLKIEAQKVNEKNGNNGLRVA